MLSSKTIKYSIETLNRNNIQYRQKIKMNENIIYGREIVNDFKRLLKVRSLEDCDSLCQMFSHQSDLISRAEKSIIDNKLKAFKNSQYFQKKYGVEAMRAIVYSCEAPEDMYFSTSEDEQTQINDKKIQDNLLGVAQQNTTSKGGQIFNKVYEVYRKIKVFFKQLAHKLIVFISAIITKVQKFFFNIVNMKYDKLYKAFKAENFTNVEASIDVIPIKPENVLQIKTETTGETKKQIMTVENIFNQLLLKTYSIEVLDEEKTDETINKVEEDFKKNYKFDVKELHKGVKADASFSSFALIIPKLEADYIFQLTGRENLLKETTTVRDYLNCEAKQTPKLLEILKKEYHNALFDSMKNVQKLIKQTRYLSDCEYDKLFEKVLTGKIEANELSKADTAFQSKIGATSKDLNEKKFEWLQSIRKRKQYASETLKAFGKITSRKLNIYMTIVDSVYEAIAIGLGVKKSKHEKEK